MCCLRTVRDSRKGERSKSVSPHEHRGVLWHYRETRVNISSDMGQVGILIRSILSLSPRCLLLYPSFCLASPNSHGEAIRVLSELDATSEEFRGRCRRLGNGFGKEGEQERQDVKGAGAEFTPRLSPPSFLFSLTLSSWGSSYTRNGTAWIRDPAGYALRTGTGRRRRSPGLLWSRGDRGEMASHGSPTFRDPALPG